MRISFGGASGKNIREGIRRFSCGAAENSPRREPWVKTNKTNQPRNGAKENSTADFLPPRPGLVDFCPLVPLSPWATFSRRSAADGGSKSEMYTSCQ